MIKKIELIHSAYAEIGLANYIFDLQPEEISAALVRLDRMGAMWDARGIRVGYHIPPNAAASSTSDDAGIPDWAEEPFYTNLALRLAPTKGKQVSVDTRLNARAGYKTLLMGNYQIPQMQMPRHMPIGLGNRRNTKNQQFFAPVDRIETTHDGFLQPDGEQWNQDSN